MNFHGRIMNIPVPEFGADEPPGYALGYRSARHTAAEIANEADEQIRELIASIHPDHLRGAAEEISILAEEGGVIDPQTEAQIERLHQIADWQVKALDKAKDQEGE